MKRRTLILFAGALVAAAALAAPEVVDEIYAIVNDEVITLQELKAFEQNSLRELEARFAGEELQKAKEEFKKNILELLINQKVVQSKLKEKNYNVDANLEMYIQKMKKENNINSDDELKSAMQSQGVDFGQWKEQMKDFIKIGQLKFDEIGSKVKIDNSQIMEFYKKNSEQFRVPEEVTLDAIFIKKDDKSAPPKDLMEQVQREVSKQNFAEIAKAHSQLPDASTSPQLGKFKKGELAKELEAVIQKMKVGDISPWIETDKGWYILLLTERQEEKMREFKDVREDIANLIREQIENEKFAGYIEQLKKESYIKILRKYPAG